MDSSTSPSKGRVPYQACVLVFVALSAWVASAVYSIRVNPEIADCAYGAAVKDAWAEKMTREYGAKVVIFGGSSCEFSIDGERMLRKFKLPTVNDGQPAGIGPGVLAESALGHLGHGDTLIVALEPAMLTEPLTPTAMAAQFSLKVRHPEWELHPVLGVGAVNWFQFANGLRPGGRTCFTALGKSAARRPFRYKSSDFRPSGWRQTEVRMPFTGPAGHGDFLSPDALLLLRRVRDWCQTNGVRSAYSLPWEYTRPGMLQDYRKKNAQFLLQIAAIFPILQDPHLGCDSNQDDFADTNLHLVTPAANERTDELAQQILHWKIWTVAELNELEKAP